MNMKKKKMNIKKKNIKMKKMNMMKKKLKMKKMKMKKKKKIIILLSLHHYQYVKVKIM